MIKSTFITLIASCFLIACATPPSVSAKPSAPVAIKSDAPKNITTNNQFTTTLTFTAQANLTKLELSLSPYKNIELVSQNNTAEFYDINADETRTLEITLRLLAPVGYLSVFATTTDTHGNKRTEAKALKFGEHPATPSRSLSNQKSNGDGVGGVNEERLILMPAEPRN